MTIPTRHWIILGLVAGLILAACGGRDSSTTSTDAPPTTSQPSGAAVDAFPVGPSALDTMTAAAFPDPLIDPAQIISGGPPPDGIPPIDEPMFLPVVDHLDLLPGSEAVVALEINGDARAYPIRAMIWHEIVNDTVGGVPVSVTYCPLCNSAVTYDRRIDGNETTFGTSGRLFSSALVMYDRATESLWTHFDGRAVVGLLAGEQLDAYASPLVDWQTFRETYPTGRVLDWTETGFTRDYGRNPYSGYDTPDNDPFLFRGALDDRATAMQRVIGIGDGSDAVAYSIEAITDDPAHVTNIEFAGGPAVVLWAAGQSSALEGRQVNDGRDVGSVGVFRCMVDGQRLTFTVEDGVIVDLETGSSWTVTGVAVDGPLVGERLDPIPHLDTFWFAWSTYQPDTELIVE